MSISQTATTSFKVELPQGIHNFGPASPDTYKIALYAPAASIGEATSIYTTAGEVVGPGYTAGGNTLVVNVPPTTGNNQGGVPTAFWSFSNTSWASSTFTARGALIYNLSKGNKSVAVLDFGADKTVSNDNFQIIFPTPDANSAIIRIS
jgi:hypothetical protein